MPQQFPSTTIQVDLKYKDVLRDTKVIVKFTDWKQFSFRVNVAQLLIKLAIWILGSKEEVEK